MKQFHQNYTGTSLPEAYQGLPTLSGTMAFETNCDIGISSGPSHLQLPTFETSGGGQHRRSSEFTPRGGGGEGNEEQDLIGTLLMDEDDAAVHHARQNEQILFDRP